MRLSAIRSVFEEFIDNSLLLVIPCAILLILPSHHLTALVLGILFYYVCTKDVCTIPAVLVLFCFLIPVRGTDPSMREGTVTEVKESYVIVEHGGSKILVYTKAEPVFDTVIRFDGSPEEIQDSKGFFRFPFGRYCRLKGITCSISPDTIQEVKPSQSLRGCLMKRIRTFEPETADCLLQVLFHISSSEEEYQGLLKDRGISLAGVFAFADLLLNYLCYESDREKARTILMFLLGSFYHWPFLIVLRSVRILLGWSGLTGKARSGITFLICLRLFPYAVYSASFLMPLIFAFADRGKQNDLSGFFFGLHSSSILFHSVNPLELLLFRRLLPLLGFCWTAALLEALFHIPMHGMILFIDSIYSILLRFALPGTMLGAGLPAYILMQLSLMRKPNAMRKAVLVFLFFQISGLFHPFAELSFINVGQGDAMLLRSPFRIADVLIDTGKPSQKNNVYMFLQAKGIHRLNTLLITHADSDHSGNQEVITQDFHPKRVLTEHHDPFQAGMLKLIDLNDIRSDNENESSVVTAFQLNGMKILLMGDSSSETEEHIIKRYPDLDCDLLKLSHHGSNTGSCPRFLDTVQPELAIVSSGAYRIYHHPSPEVIERLYNRRIPYLDTKQEGDITILFLPGVNLLITASGKIAIIRV